MLTYYSLAVFRLKRQQTAQVQFIEFEQEQVLSSCCKQALIIIDQISLGKSFVAHQ